MTESSFAIATNACSTDDERIGHTVTSWLRTWEDRLTEILIVVDREPPSGRIANLHGDGGSRSRLDDELRRLQVADSRIRIVDLPPKGQLDHTLARWFGQDRPMRCQAGTPVAAFLYAMEQVRSDPFMRADCDMLFYDDGFLDEAIRLLGQGVDLVEPPRLGGQSDRPRPQVSTRALILDRKNLHPKLPMEAHRLDWLRRVHRALQGRSTYLALEQMFEREVRSGRLTHQVLDGAYGLSLHVPRRRHFAGNGINGVIRRVEAGDIPPRQLRAGWDLVPSKWESLDGSVLR